MLNTVKENKRMYTDHQVDRAKKAQELYHALGTPSIKDFKAIIMMNAIDNNSVTTEDINLAEKIFGPDIGSLKGNTTRTKPLHVANDYIEIPKVPINTHYNVALCMNGMFVNGIAFLTTISCKTTDQPRVESYKSAIDCL
jgi:hypothetical protein